MLPGQVKTDPTMTPESNLILNPTNGKNGPIFLNSPYLDKQWDIVGDCSERKLVTETKHNNESLVSMASNPHKRTLH